MAYYYYYYPVNITDRLDRAEKVRYSIPGVCSPHNIYSYTVSRARLCNNFYIGVL